MREKKSKVRYRGVFNMSHSVHILYCFAVSERKAYVNFCSQLAKKHGVEIVWVMAMFDGSKDNFSITVEERK